MVGAAILLLMLLGFVALAYRKDLSPVHLLFLSKILPNRLINISTIMSAGTACGLCSYDEILFALNARGRKAARSKPQ